MSKFRKKPIVIEAVQWNGYNVDEIIALGGTCEIEHDFAVEDELKIKTLEGIMTASLNDWIIKGVSGELYPCKPDIFVQTYEEIECDYHQDGRHRYIPCDDHSATCWCGDQSSV